MRRTLIGGIAVCALLAPAAPAFAEGEPILASGMEHPAVKRVQKLLGVTPQTGYFGPVTLEAVKTYQRAHGIPTTGVVGPLTWASLTEQQKSKHTQAKKSKQKQKDKKAAKKKAAKKPAKKAAKKKAAKKPAAMPAAPVAPVM